MLDGWVTTHLANRKEGWPTGGVRGLLELAQSNVLMLAIPSSDKVGRKFPLVALTDGKGLSFEDAETWCDAALGCLGKATRGEISVDATLQHLHNIEPDLRAGPTGDAALWVTGQVPLAPDAQTVEELFNSG
ncbi:unnamed protein product [Ectocarpus sp. 12 AP-2014]